MTSHELAKKLLEGPDLPVVIFTDSDFHEVDSVKVKEAIYFDVEVEEVRGITICIDR